MALLHIIDRNRFNDLPAFRRRNFEKQQCLCILGVFSFRKQDVEYPVLGKEVVQEALYFVAVRHSGVSCVNVIVTKLNIFPNYLNYKV